MSPSAPDPDLPPDQEGRDLPLAEILRELEGSTHGGPRHAILFDSLKTRVAREPQAALDQIESLPSSARSVLLMVISGLGRVMLPEILDRLSHPSVENRRDAAMVLCIWATRGLLFGGDRKAIEQARNVLSVRDADATTIRFIDNALGRIRT